MQRREAQEETDKHGIMRSSADLFLTKNDENYLKYNNNKNKASGNDPKGKQYIKKYIH